jgi:ketosteroid isomerase-like protein
MADRTQIARECYDAYVRSDRSLIEPHLADDFRFYSPPDPGIDRERYFERCWPGHTHSAGYEFKRLIEDGDEVVVTYEATRTDGSRFRNTEVLTFDADDRIARVEVYFGWDLP